MARWKELFIRFFGGDELLTWRNLFISFIVASALIRLGLVFINQGLWWDEAVYLGLADGIRNGHYSLATGAEGFRPPLLPSLLAVLNLDILSGRLFVWVLTLAAIYLAYVLGREVQDEETGLAFAVLLSSYHQFVFFTTKLLAEALFVALLLASLITLRRAFEGESAPAWLPGGWWGLTGFVTGLAFLARYPATVVIAAYLAYAVWRRRYRGAGIVLTGFLAALSPWLLHNSIVWGSPVTPYVQNLQVFSSTSGQVWYFFYNSFFQVFGPLGALFVLGAVFIILRRQHDWSDVRSAVGFEEFILLMAMGMFVVFSVPAHKEVRYLVSFFPLYALVSVLAVRYMKREREALFAAVFVLSLLGLSMGANMVLEDSEGAKALVDASEWLEEREGAVITEFYSETYPPSFSVRNPWLEVVGGKEVHVFPRERDDMDAFMEENPDIRYAVIYSFGPRTPGYAAEYALGWRRVASFEQWGNPEAVIVYETVPAEPPPMPNGVEL